MGTQKDEEERVMALIRRLACMFDLPWCMVGDYNDLLTSDDKVERCDHPNYLFQGFREATQDVGLVDIPLEGYPFTWRFAMGTDHSIEQRLD